MAAGPGSFTGLRIGVAALKGLAWAAEQALLRRLDARGDGRGTSPTWTGCSSAPMDARRKQVYNALFERTGGALTRLTPDRADRACGACGRAAKCETRQIIVVGDGAAAVL